jgi:predicted HAD superfamily Cof-like phosphohydrolase
MNVINVDFTNRQRVDKALEDKRETPELIREFLTAYEVPSNARSVALYETLIREEAKEVREAAAHLLKELTDLEYVLEAHRQVGGDSELGADIIEDELDVNQLLALMDAYEADVERIAMLRVHYSNMSKLGDDGRPVRRPEDGKVLKGPNYKPCELEDLLR